MSKSIRLEISRALLTVLILFCLRTFGHGHELFTSYSTIEVRDNQLSCLFKFDQTDLAMVFDLDENGDENVTKDELQLNLDRISEYVRERVAISGSGDSVSLEPQGTTVTEDDLGNVFVQCEFRGSPTRQLWKLTVSLGFLDDFGPKHKNLAKIICEDEIQQTIFTMGDQVQVFSLERGDISLASQILQFVWLGMEHIFIGYDHILFLLGLIVIGGSFKNLVKIVTSFTVAHSITLILAALNIVSIPGRLVESVIALSIVYIAVENFIVKNSDERWLITFIFGLMHGFGFAGVLRELGLPTQGLVASLLSFNVGVEIGQLAIVSLVFPVVLWLSSSKWKRQFVYGVSSFILVFGLLWFIERAFAFELPGM